MMKPLEFFSAAGGGGSNPVRPAGRDLIASLVLLVLSLALLGACSTPSILVGAGASGAVAASEERGLGGALRDSRIKAELNFELLEEDRILFKGLSTSVYEGRVLLTGIAKSAAKRDAAVRIAWQTPGVKEVINEIIIDPSGASGSFSRDTWISTKLRTNLMFDFDIDAINYSIDTLRGTVHLLGVAQNQEELEKVLDHARNLAYVKKVVNHVILKTDPRRMRQPAQAMRN
ncbi:MAG TPA: BON domain-containing protein [Alphaproteobacteria bacterium]|nr:BON domain-containing protein [Alphaproteobacteria bacterium]